MTEDSDQKSIRETMGECLDRVVVGCAGQFDLYGFADGLYANYVLVLTFVFIMS